MADILTDRETLFKNLQEKYPFMSIKRLISIIEYYGDYRYKKNKPCLAWKIDISIKEFFDTCTYEISEQRLTLIIRHTCLLSEQMQVKKEHAIKYLNYTEEDFE